MKPLLFLSLLFLLSLACNAGYYANVSHVLDGDTITVIKPNSTKYRIRLAYIDAPEIAKKHSKSQPYGKESKAYLEKLILNKKVLIKQIGTDPYGRFLAEIYLDTLNINKVMVRTGNAWTYSYNPKDDYVRLESIARSKKLGLWSLKNPINPYAWRKMNPK